MEKIDRELLIKEISSRLPYGIKVKVYGWDKKKGEVGIPLKVYSINTDGHVQFEANNYNINYLDIDNCLLYLRPISSMTSEEWVELCDCSLKDEMSWVMTKGRKFFPVQNREDYLNSKYFDCRGLIPMDLALEAPDGMYKSK